MAIDGQGSGGINSGSLFDPGVALSHRRLALAFCLSLAVPAFAADAPAVSSEVLLKSEGSWDGTAYVRYPDGPPELTILKITIPPNTDLPWHQHPMPNAAYVVSGELTVERRDGGQVKQIKSGDVLPEMVNATHRGRTGDNPVVLIVFYAGTKGMPLSGVVK
jgi:quercetin dioxygenase-like cupin family protein